jgi:hypothetical protein
MRTDALRRLLAALGALSLWIISPPPLEAG